MVGFFAVKILLITSLFGIKVVIEFGIRCRPLYSYSLTTILNTHAAWLAACSWAVAVPSRAAWALIQDVLFSINFIDFRYMQLDSKCNSRGQ